jgi:diguanylate cyclase (GGDEF)-like protein
MSDIHATPLGMMPGIVIHANEFLSILSGRTLRFVPDPFVFLISWLVGICILLLFVMRRFAIAIAAFFLAVFGLFFGAQFLFSKDMMMNPLILETGPLFALLIGGSAGSLRLLVENHLLESKAIHDKLTGLYKYEYLRERLEEIWKTAKKENWPVTVVMTDLDKFKNINDTLGHETGNLMIQRAGNVIKESVRKFDIVARYGGDEFVILLVETSSAEAAAYKDRLRNYYHQMATGLKEPLLQHSSISIGYATFEPGSADAPATTQELVERADKDLFEDKKARRGWPSR